MQVCPALRSKESSTFFAAIRPASCPSSSGSHTAADLPPSSKMRRFIIGAARPAIRRPTAVDPVKEIKSTPA